MRLTLVLTHQCNLACTYCYAGEKFARAMSPEVAAAAIHRAFTPASTDPMTLSFFGGEPMMAFDRMLASARLARNLARRQGRPITYTLTTNGTLLSERQLDFLYQYDFYVTISLDGPAEAQDRHRPFKSGRGSSPVVWRNVERAAAVLQHFSVLMVLNPDTVDHVEAAVRRLQELRVARVHLAPNLDCEWSEERLARAAAVYGRLAMLYLEARDAPWPLYVHPFVDILTPRDRDSETARPPSCTTHESPHSHACGFGDGDWSVAPSGNIYPCARLVAEDNRLELRLGTACAGPRGDRVRAVKAEADRRQAAWNTAIECNCIAYMPGDAQRGALQKEKFDAMAAQALADARLAPVG